jgi:hypothetical protein
MQCGQYPFVTANPGAVVPVTRRSQSLTHRQQILQRDAGFAGINLSRQFAEVPIEGDFDTVEDSLLDCNADKCSEDAFRYRLYILQVVRPSSVELTAQQQLTVSADQQAVQSRHGIAISDRVIEISGHASFQLISPVQFRSLRCRAENRRQAYDH